MVSPSRLADLAAFFHPSDIEWRAGATTRDKTKAMALAYLTSRAVQQRFDDVCGPANWRNEFKEGPGGGVICGISVLVGREDGTGEWVTKWDGADNSQVEAVKGGLSGSMKRAAVLWAVGRYLYELPSPWVRLDDRGRFAETPKIPREFLPSAEKTSRQPEPVSEVATEPPDYSDKLAKLVEWTQTADRAGIEAARNKIAAWPPSAQGTANAAFHERLEAIARAETVARNAAEMIGKRIEVEEVGSPAFLRAGGEQTDAEKSAMRGLHAEAARSVGEEWNEQTKDARDGLRHIWAFEITGGATDSVSDLTVAGLGEMRTRLGDYERGKESLFSRVARSGLTADALAMMADIARYEFQKPTDMKGVLDLVSLFDGDQAAALLRVVQDDSLIDHYNQSARQLEAA